MTEAYEVPEVVNEPPRLSSGRVGLEISQILAIAPEDGPSSLTFSVEVHNANVDEVLYERRRLLYVNEDGQQEQAIQSDCDPETLLEPEIPPDQDETRHYEFSFSENDLVDGKCHILEMAVSAEFQLSCDQLSDNPNLFASPDETGNVATAIWYIKRVLDADDDRVVCPTVSLDDIGMGAGL